jgi:hypothetical protein
LAFSSVRRWVGQRKTKKFLARLSVRQAERATGLRTSAVVVLVDYIMYPQTLQGLAVLVLTCWCDDSSKLIIDRTVLNVWCWQLAEWHFPDLYT